MDRAVIIHSECVAKSLPGSRGDGSCDLRGLIILQYIMRGCCGVNVMATVDFQVNLNRVGRQRVAPVAAPSAPLDLSHLRRFTVGNKALEREVLELFSEQAPLTLQAMQLAQTEKAWRDAAHTLKGSAFAVGANEIARTAAEAELARGEPQRWSELLVRLDAAIRDAQAYIAVAA